MVSLVQSFLNVVEGGYGSRYVWGGGGEMVLEYHTL